MRLKDFTDTLTANASHNFFPRMCYNTHKKHDKREPGFFKENFRDLHEHCVYAVKCTVAMIERTKCTNSAAKVWKVDLWKTVAMDQCQSIEKCWMNLLMYPQPKEVFEQLNIVIKHNSTQK